MSRRRGAMTALLLLLAAGFVALGVWQMQRRAWKHALIAAVDARIHARPIAAPGPPAWPRLTAERDAYRRITATGRFLPGRQTLVQAVTDLGAGYWVLAPLDTGHFILLVNRGFVATRKPPPTGEAAVTVTGLLRISEPGGGFLRANDPAADRWHSRDVAAITRARRLGPTAPYFLDADAARNAPGQPTGGLTVVRFADNHLAYALTWFVMAGLCLWGLWRLRSAPDESEEARA